MNNWSFNKLFMIFAWINFFASGKSILAAILLAISGLYELCDLIFMLIRKHRE